MQVDKFNVLLSESTAEPVSQLQKVAIAIKGSDRLYLSVVGDDVATIQVGLTARVCGRHRHHHCPIWATNQPCLFPGRRLPR